MRNTKEFEKFFTAYYAQAFHLALSLTRDEEVSRDIVADSFEFLIRNNKELTVPQMRNYLYAIIKNKCADYYRRMSVYDKYSEYVIHSASIIQSSDAFAEHERKIDIVSNLLGELRPHTREIIESHYLDGMKYAEIAKKYEISESTVKKHIMKGLKFLREKLSKFDI